MNELHEKLKALGMEDKDITTMSAVSDLLVAKTEKLVEVEKTANEEAKKALEVEIEVLKTAIKDISDKMVVEKEEKGSLSIADAVQKMFKDNGIDSIEKVAELASKGKVIALKADNPITNASLTGNFSRTQEVSPLRFAPVRETAFYNRGISVGTVTTGKNIILWTVGAYTGNVAYINELADGAAGVDGSTITGTEKTRKLSKCISRAIVSKDSLEDIPQLASRIQMKTMENMGLWLDTEIWNGTGSAQNDTRVYGIIPAQSTPFSATGIPKVYGANVADLADACKLMAKKNKHSVNTVWMSDTLAFKLQHTKDLKDNYIINRLVDGTLVMGGYNVITDETLFGGSTEKMLVGDPSKIQLWVKRGLEAEFERVAKSDSYNLYIYGRQQVLVEDEDIKGLIYVEDVTAALDLITEARVVV